MLEETIPFDELWNKGGRSGLQTRSITAFVRFMERRLGARFVYSAKNVPFNRPALLDLFVVAETMRKRGVIRQYAPMQARPDEPPLYAWTATVVSTIEGSHFSSGGHPTDDRLALTATLAEAVERHVWFEQIDYLDSPTVATVADMAKRHPILAPERFAGLSAQQRAEVPRLQLNPESKYLWARGHSWITGRSVWIPAQVVSANKVLAAGRKERGEPLILHNSTNGLATHTTKESAVLAGALERIERDAYMILWLNQLTLPRFDIETLCQRSPSLARLVAQCRRYRLQVHALRMLTDAPAYAVCVVVEDTTTNNPRLTLGLRADKDAAYAVEKALTEALRMRNTARNMLKEPPKNWNPEKKADEVGHMDRLLYWMVGDRQKRLAFLTNGPMQHFVEPWEHDSAAEHLARIASWCRERGYELATVSMTKSKGNPTPWHIEMVVMPELQPIHLHENARNVGGARLKEVPTLFGYPARDEPYVDDPHPFT